MDLRALSALLARNTHELRNEIDSGKKINGSAKRSAREPKRSARVYPSLEAFSPGSREKSEARCAQVKGVEQQVAQKSDLFCFPLSFLSPDERPSRAIAGRTLRSLHWQYLPGLLSADHAARAREAASPSSLLNGARSYLPFHHRQTERGGKGDGNPEEVQLDRRRLLRAGIAGQSLCP